MTINLFLGNSKQEINIKQLADSFEIQDNATLTAGFDIVNSNTLTITGKLFNKTSGLYENDVNFTSTLDNTEGVVLDTTTPSGGVNNTGTGIGTGITSGNGDWTTTIKFDSNVTTDKKLTLSFDGVAPLSIDLKAQ